MSYKELNGDFPKATRSTPSPLAARAHGGCGRCRALIVECRRSEPARALRAPRTASEWSVFDLVAPTRQGRPNPSILARDHECMSRPVAGVLQTISSLALTAAIASAGASASLRNELRAGRPAHAVGHYFVY
jgi:hypothetical protein